MNECWKITAWVALLGLLAVNSGILIVGTYALSDPTVLYSRYYERRSEAAESNANPAKGGQEAGVQRPKDGESEAPQRNENPDPSKSQTEPSWVPYAQGASAIANAIFAGVLVLVTCGLLGATRRAAESSVTQARVAEQTISVLERPRLFPVCEPNFIEPFRDLTKLHDTTDRISLAAVPSVGFSLKNYGRTPAVLFNISAKVVGPQSDAPSEETAYVLTTLPKDRIIHPTETAEPRTAALTAFKGSILLTEYNELMAGRIFWWFFGTVGFDDIWGGKNTLHFCWRYDNSLQTFGPYPRERNYTEHEPAQRHYTPPTSKVYP